VDWDRYNELITLRDSGRIEEAIGELTRLGDGETDPRNKAIILIAIAGGLRQLSRFSDARLQINEACAILGPEHESYPRAAFQAALLDIDQENWKGALKRLDDIRRKFASVLQVEDHKDLMEEVERRRGMALTKLGRFQEARQLLESVRLLEYDRVATLGYLGACDFELKDYDAAMEVYQELLSLEPSSVFQAYANYHRGTILFQRGQLARAKFEFEQCLSCPDRGEIPDDNLLQWLIDTCKGLNLERDAARYAQMRKQPNGTHLLR
jgi:tetratricopeptide (TPR) repeat protein